MSVALAELPTAPFGIRITAVLFDVFLAFAFLYGPLLQITGGHPGHWQTALHLLVLLAVAMMWKSRGGTPGKLLLGIRVVDAQTREPLGAGRALGRGLACILSLLSLGLGYLWLVFDPRHQALHDKLAGTLVVYAPRKLPAA